MELLEPCMGKVPCDVSKYWWPSRKVVSQSLHLEL